MNKTLGLKGLKIVGEYLVKTGFVFLFMKIPQMLFSKYMNEGAFELEHSFVYFSLVLCAVCGSIMNSEIFGEKISNEVKTDSSNVLGYFRKKLLIGWIYDFTGFWLAFSVWGMNVFKAFYLSIVILFSRFIGEMIHLIILRFTGKTFYDIRGASVFISLASLICAYFVPFINGGVPSAYNIVFSNIWLPIILVVGSVFLYYIWNYRGYDKVLTVLHDLDNKEEKPFTLKETFENKPEISDKEVSKLIGQGNDFKIMQKMFIERNHNMIIGGLVTRILIITAVLAAVIITHSMGNKDIIYKVISYSMPLIAFIMYAMSRGRLICKEMYNDCDSHLIGKDYYRNRTQLFNNYLMRLKFVAVVDIIPAVYLSLVYLIAGILADREGSATTIAAVCIGIIVFSFLFSNYNVFMYYICMPYASENNKRKVVYNFINISIYLLCYACIFVKTTSLFFTLAGALVFAVTLSITATVVAKFAINNFKADN